MKQVRLKGTIVERLNRFLMLQTINNALVFYDLCDGHKATKVLAGIDSMELVGYRPDFQQHNKPPFMSNVEAYLCDSCGEIKSYDAVIGFSNQKDIYDQRESYKEINNPKKASYHYCTDCFHSKVYVPAINSVDRSKDEEGYKQKVRELLFILKSQALAKVRKI